MGKGHKVFKIPFKFCPSCGGEFYFNERLDKEYCGGCNKVSFKIFQQYYAFYTGLRREHYKEYPHAD